MKHYLDSLLHTPGVRAAGFVAADGLGIAWSERAARSGEEPLDTEGLAALAGSWLAELTRCGAPLGWSAPQRCVLRATRGTLILAQGPQVVLVVLLDGGMSHEDLRLPMESALARLQRHLRNLGSGEAREQGAPLPHRTNTPLSPALRAPTNAELASEERKAGQTAPSGE